MSKKLYRVTCRGLTTRLLSDYSHGIAYVVADDPTHAYQIVADDLKARKIGNDADRALGKVELIAEDASYPHCKTRLYLHDVSKLP